MVGLLCNGFEGMLLVFIAAQLRRLAPLRTGAAWLAAQTLTVAAALAVHWSPRAAVMLMAPYAGFQLFAFFAARLHAQLAEQSRTAERLRIARELHDALGHHLTAMSLNLEVAAHQTSGAAHDNVRAAQSLARLLLGDVRELAYAMKQGQATDLVEGLARLTDRERDVLRLMAGGYSNREIADVLATAEGTVKNQVSSILAKLGVRDRTRAVLKAIEAGVI